MTTLRTRREFLHTSALGAATSLTVPVFLERTFGALHTEAEKDSSTQATTGKDGSIFVIVQLAGGNDGLNTLVPHGDDAYYKARPRLAVKKKALLPLSAYSGFNENLPFLRELYQSGDLAVVQGVGYPNPNRSHFRSTEIWQTATDSNRFSSTGWLGRYFDNLCQGAAPDPTTAISVGKKQPQAFVAKRNPGISLTQPELYRWMQGRRPDALAADFFREMNRPDAEERVESGGSVTEVSGGKMRSEESNLDFLERTALDAQISSARLRKLAGKYRGGSDYPAIALGRSLQLVSRMIAGGLGTRVYYVSHGGFDTHNSQAVSHGRLLKGLNDSLGAFHADLEKQGNADRVVMMTFSEFGRRVKENANAGTDHGTAAPLFVMGKAVRGGLYGRHPSLTDLERGDLKFSIDFRSVYATVLDQWLQASSEQILGRRFDTLKLFG